MKKVLFILALFVSFSNFAQQKESKAIRNMSNEMKEVLSLSEEQSDKVYEIRFEFKTKMDVLKEENLGASKVEFRVLNRPNIKSYSKALNDLLGNENVNKWNAYSKEKRAKANS
jgi:formyltetrahydrofolate synthetase